MSLVATLQILALVALGVVALVLAVFTLALCKAAALGDQHPSPHPAAPSPDPRSRQLPEDRAA